MAQPRHLKKSGKFPRLSKTKNRVTSEPDTSYNCIAYACGITNKKYWPTFDPDFYWPPDLPKTETIETFVRLFENRGYQRVSDGSKGKYKEGFEKVAIYASRGGTPKHAALQKGPNRWASKLGNWYDIEHTIDAVSSGDYGEIVVFLERKLRTQSLS
jgi:hypothetical protein